MKVRFLTMALFIGIILSTFYLFAGAPTEAQAVSCDNTFNANVLRTGQPFGRSWSNTSGTQCIRITSDLPVVTFDLDMSGGSVAMFVMIDGSYVANGQVGQDIAYPILLDREQVGDPWFGGVALVPNNSASFGVTAFIESGTTNVDSDPNVLGLAACFQDPNCDSFTPAGEVYAFVSLDNVGDVRAIPFETCEGEMQVSIEGLLDPGHIALHILSPDSAIPNRDTRSNVSRSWNPKINMLFSFRSFTRSEVQRNPVWMVYIVRTGTPTVGNRRLPVGIRVKVNPNCGDYPLDVVTGEGDVVTAARRGDSRLGGMDVATYCRGIQIKFITRTVDNRYWVCYEPLLGSVARVMIQRDFNNMCVNTYGRGAYAVKEEDRATSWACYR